MRLRSWLGVMVMSAVLAANAGAWAQGYPDRPVRMLIAFPGGGTIDTLGRILAQKLTEAWGQNVVIENRPGAGGNIGAAAAAKSAPDGYTLHFGAQTLAVNVTLQPSKEFDPVKDFDPIMLVATAQDVLVVPPNSPFHSVKELIDYAKAHPGELNYASLALAPAGISPPSCSATSPASSSNTCPIPRCRKRRPTSSPAASPSFYRRSAAISAT